jgi:putative nucleotidyltransferase with HDIG domain
MFTFNWDRSRRWFSLNDRGWRILVGLICVLGVAFFLHFREVRLDSFEVNETARKYYVAQVDFEFPDLEETVLLKQEVMAQVGPIYQIEERELREERHGYENRLIHDREWKVASPQTSFEAMVVAADELEALLSEARFTDARTLQTLGDLKLLDGLYFEWIPKCNGPEMLPRDVWDRIETVLEHRGLNEQAIGFAMKAFKKRGWTFFNDLPLQKSLATAAARSVPERYTFVPAGTRILEAGEKITNRHLAMFEAMKEAISDGRDLDQPMKVGASLLLALIFVTVTALYFRINQLPFIRSLSEVALFVTIVLLTLCFAKGAEWVVIGSRISWLGSIHYPIVAPFATILICILLSPRTALYAATFLSIILSVSLAVNLAEFLILNLVTSIAVIIGSRHVRKRKEVFGITLKAWLASLPVLLAFAMGPKELDWGRLATDSFSSLFFLLLTAVLVVGLLPLLESLFHVLTDMTLMEYMDPTGELLQRMSLEIPGSYQHSLVLANLAERCAVAIGANGLFCRAATMYHDVGKLMNPRFFTENQGGTPSLHQLLTPQESARVIISHVPDGVELAKRHHLPDTFIDIIKEHHGTTLVYYFYAKQVELQGGKKEAVDETLFRYPGPRPRTRESAIIMIADSVEAASRALDQASEETIGRLVDQIIHERMEEGQFDECQLTFEELQKVKKALVQALMVAHHVRIKYPKR